MSWSWIVVTLVLIGAEDPQPSPPTPPNLSGRLDLGVGKTPKGPIPSACMRKTIDPHSTNVLLETICENLCPEGLADEMTIAARRLSVDEVDGCRPLGSAKQATSSDASPRSPLSSRPHAANESAPATMVMTPATRSIGRDFAPIRPR